MSDNFAVAAITQAHAVDTEFFVRRGMTKGYQAMSILALPIYLTFTISRFGRSHITVNRILRATWVSGAAGGGGFEYLRSAYSNPEHVRSRRIVAAYNMNSVRADDHATIGSLLFAVLAPALFWKRANVFNRQYPLVSLFQSYY
ncbi:hypothetical protein EUX98_g300 [Antrodiella citrinella]|uniref:Uncharacterized protein n=1 Tax=Antrodiella citrinella TaxID=2447956 RepID=A0A4V3XJQ7_9APHY|nr:hypothetical protein EUX98_g300 [Antrodiella citrinella]